MAEGETGILSHVSDLRYTRFYARVDTFFVWAMMYYAHLQWHTEWSSIHQMKDLQSTLREAFFNCQHLYMIVQPTVTLSPGAGEIC